MLHRSGIPAIYVTHDQEEALALGDQMALLNEGTIVQKGKPESLFQNPHNRWVAQFLGVTNIYSAKVISTKPLILQTGFGKFSAYAEGKFSVSSNETIWIAVTQINEISDSFSSSENILQGICLSCLFKGDHYQTQLLLSDQSIFTYSSSNSSQLHEKIILNISPKNIIFLDQ